MEDHFIEGCKKRDRNSFELLYKKYAPVLLGVCYRYCNNKTEAEDVLQEGFIKVFKKIESFEGKGSFEGWLRRIMVNTAINNYKSGLKHYFHEDIDDKVIAIEDDEMKIEVEGPLNKEVLLKLINELPTGYQLVFNMFAIDGLTHNEIADELNISINTSKSQLFKARKLLRKRISEFQNKLSDYEGI